MNLPCAFCGEVHDDSHYLIAGVPVNGCPRIPTNHIYIDDEDGGRLYTLEEFKKATWSD